jgi:pyruvate dehydrogenase E1 component beta subunit
MEYEAVDEGTVAKLVVEAGTDGVKVGTVIALIAGRGRGRCRPGQRDRGACIERGRSRGWAGGRDRVSPAEEASSQQAVAAVRAIDPPASLRVEPEVAEGTELVKTTVREALRDAMAEEMRATIACS